MLLADAAAPGAFAREQERLLEGFAGEVGTLLEEAGAAAGRARLGDKFETLAAISRELSSTIKIDEMLEKMLDHTCEIVPYDRCALFIADRAGRSLTLRAQRGFLPEGSEECRIPIDHGLAGFVATQLQPVNFSDLAERGTAIEIVPRARGRSASAPSSGCRCWTRRGSSGSGCSSPRNPAASTPSTSRSSQSSPRRPRR